MADYQTQFFRIFKVGSAENAEKADDIRDALAAKLDRHDGRPLGSSWQWITNTVPARCG